MNTEIENSLKFWNKIHTSYERGSIATDAWLDEFSDVIDNCSGTILDLGCGGGNDTLYLINRGKKVAVCDQSVNAIENIHKNFPEFVEAKCFNMLDGIDFCDSVFEIVVADLSLHYFTLTDTERILDEIRRVLVPGGHLFVRVNSIADINHGAGEGKEIEHHLYLTSDGMLKRFFDRDDVLNVFSDFDITYCEEQPMMRYRKPKVCWCVGMILR